MQDARNLPEVWAPIRQRLETRHLVFAIAVLGCAIALNVIIAWGLALWVDIDKARIEAVGASGSGTDRFEVVKYSYPGAVLITCSRRRWELTNAEPMGTPPDELLPSWSRLHSPTREYAVGTRSIELRASNGFGVPLLCLSYEYEMYGEQPHFKVKGGIEIIPSGSQEPRIIPLRPIWPGFAVNSILYAILIWLAFFAPVIARRIARHRRGCCLACGYNLGGMLRHGCPECGWRRKGWAPDRVLPAGKPDPVPPDGRRVRASSQNGCPEIRWRRAAVVALRADQSGARHSLCKRRRVSCPRR